MSWKHVNSFSDLDSLFSSFYLLDCNLHFFSQSFTCMRFSIHSFIHPPDQPTVRITIQWMVFPFFQCTTQVYFSVELLPNGGEGRWWGVIKGQSGHSETNLIKQLVLFAHTIGFRLLLTFKMWRRFLFSLQHFCVFLHTAFNFISGDQTHMYVCMYVFCVRTLTN